MDTVRSRWPLLPALIGSILIAGICAVAAGAVTRDGLVYLRAAGTVRSVLEVLFPPEVQKVELKLRGTPMRELRAGHVTLKDPEFGESIPLAFVAQGLAGRVCIERIAGEDASGATVSRLGRRPCHQ